MSIRTTAILSVTTVLLSIIAHQSDPDIIPNLLSVIWDGAQKLSHKFDEISDMVVEFINRSIGIDLYVNKRRTSQDDGPVRDSFDSTFNSKKQQGKSNNKQGSKTKPAEVLFTKEELKQYNGEEGSKGTYLAILGSVFDVSKGKDHYGPGGGYHFFTGKDGTRAFVSGKFDEAGLTDDVSGLPPKDLKALQDWYKFYKKDYVYVGKVIGNFYNEKGNPTKEYHQFMKGVKQAALDSADEEKEKQTMPPCNVEWDKAKGLRVWCTTRSGGISRSWAGVPRRLVGAGGKKSRCVCVEPKTAASDPRLGEYDDCPPGADGCWVDNI